MFLRIARCLNVLHIYILFSLLIYALLFNNLSYLYHSIRIIRYDQSNCKTM